MQNAHTPGPWKAPYLWDASGIAKNAVVQDCQPGCTWKRDTADICYLPPDPLNRANARLIAAAPDMLAALNESLALLEYMAGDRESAKQHKTLALARAAIAKATGK